MGKKVDINKALLLLEKAKEELIKKRIKAIKMFDVQNDEQLRLHMLAIEGFRKDLETLLVQLSSYIEKNNILGLEKKKKGRAKAEKPTSEAPSGRGGYRRKPLPDVGTSLHGRFQGKDYYATVKENGIVIDGIDGVFPSMTSAATVITGRKTLSGWAFWKVINP